MGACASDAAVDQDQSVAPEKRPKAQSKSKSKSKLLPESTNSSNPNNAEQNGTKNLAHENSKTAKNSKSEKPRDSDGPNFNTPNESEMPSPATSSTLPLPMSPSAPSFTPAKKGKRADMDEEMSLLDALKLGPPLIKEHIAEVVEMLEELLDDAERGQLSARKVKNRLNECVYILKNLKIPDENIGDRAARLAQQISNSSSNEVATDKEVQAWMQHQFGTSARGSKGKNKEKNREKEKEQEKDEEKGKTEKDGGKLVVKARASVITEEGTQAVAEEFVDRVRLMTRAKRVLMVAAKVRLSESAKGMPIRDSSEYKSLQEEHTHLERIEFELVGFTTRIVLRASLSWQFDIFRLDTCTHHAPLSTLMMHLFEKLDLFRTFSIHKHTFARFMGAVEEGYKDIPYHNRIHAADVVQNTFFFITRDALKDKLTKADMVAALVGAAIHDLGHPGTNNAFQVLTNSDLALEYNDQSVLENMHCARAFQILRKEGYNIFSGMPQKTRQEIRSAIIAMVLSTDMKFHFEMLAHLQQRLADEKKAVQDAHPEEKKESHHGDIVHTPHRATLALAPIDKKKDDDSKKRGLFDPPTEKDRLLLLKVCLHCADLGNPAKPHETMMKWTQAITEEFFCQGDRERELGFQLSPMMDRTKPNIEKSQVGFIDVVVMPLFRCFQTLVPDIQFIIDQMTKNKEFWLHQLKIKEGAPMTPKPASMPSPSVVPASFALSPPSSTASSSVASSSTSSSSGSGSSSSSAGTASTSTSAGTTTSTSGTGSSGSPTSRPTFIPNSGGDTSSSTTSGRGSSSSTSTPVPAVVQVVLRADGEIMPTGQ